MPCYYPLDAWKFKGTVAFRPPGQKLRIPCGQCIGCRLERSRQWATRCLHESQQHNANCFITLTYSPLSLPESGSLVKKDFQDFMKRFRKKITPTKIKYFHCGEYGDKLQRPHYHACIFGYDFPDRKLYTVRNETRLYTSETLQALWPQGFSTIGDVTFESAAYVARYCVKKVTGQQAEEHYTRVDETTGEIHFLEPEYATMSRGGRNGKGIGHTWFETYETDVFPSDECIVRGKKTKPPRYYEKIYQHEHPEEYEKLKLKREKKQKEMKKDNTPRRLKDREKVKKLNSNF